MSENIIIHGDSIKELMKMAPNSVDLIFADPPYWMRTEGELTRVEGTRFNGCDDSWDKFNSLKDYESFTREWLSSCRRVLKPNGSIWVIGSMQCIYTIGAIMQELDYWFVNDVIWHKRNPAPNFMGTRLNNSHETLIWATKSKSSKFTFNYKTAKELNTDTISVDDFKQGRRKQLGSVWSISLCTGSERLKDDAGNKLHNTQKPEELIKRIILISSRQGDIVLDPFAGTMTTDAVAKKYGRKYVMIEKEEKYCHYGKIRLENTKFEDSPIARAKYDEKPLKVSMKEMISEKFFIEGEDFCFKDGQPVAKLLADGKLKCNGEIIDMHSCAAKMKGVKASRLNGFDYWYVIRDGSPKSIADIQEAYRKIKTAA